MIPLPEAIKREVIAAPLPPMHRTSLAKIEAGKKQRRLATANAIRRDYSQNERQKFNL